MITGDFYITAIITYLFKRYNPFCFVKPTSKNRRFATILGQVNIMTSSPSIISADKVSLEEFEILLKQYPSLIKRVSDEKGGMLSRKTSI
jgi:hypothetical protein